MVALVHIYSSEQLQQPFLHLSILIIANMDTVYDALPLNKFVGSA